MTKSAKPMVASGAGLRMPVASAPTTPTTPAMTGNPSRSRIDPQLAAPQGRAGPTPIRNSSSRKSGALTRSNHGAPTLTVSPETACTASG